MEIREASDKFQLFLKETDSKTEIKIYEKFIAILSDLNNRDLTNDELQAVEEKLGALSFNQNLESRKKYYRQNLKQFTLFLKEKLSLVSKGYYLAIGMSLGMCFGVAFGAAFDNVSSGLVVGMLIGMAFGATKDSKSKKEGKVLNTVL